MIFNNIIHEDNDAKAKATVDWYCSVCGEYGINDCSNCGANPYKDCTNNPCDWDIDKILPAVEKWAREHPEEVKDVRSTTSNHHR